jgi:hypothetical protein
MGRSTLGLKRFAGKTMSMLGFNPRVVFSYRHLPKLRKQKYEWIKQGGRITRLCPILTDYSDSAGVAVGHYFHQDLLVASFIFERNPNRHIDVGSRIDGFVAHVAAFRQVEVLDIREMKKSEHENILFSQADLMSDVRSEITDSISCLHAIEHFGLGRYGDPIDVDGHKKGITNLIRMLKKNGILYISFPIGNADQVHFNAHRVFHPKSIFDFAPVNKNLRLLRFDFVDDKGRLNINASVSDAVDKTEYGCGIYTFQKIPDQLGGGG